MRELKRNFGRRCQQVIHAVAFTYVLYGTLIVAIYLALAWMGPADVGGVHY